MAMEFLDDEHMTKSLIDVDDECSSVMAQSDDIGGPDHDG